MSHAADVRAGYRYVLSPTGEIYPGWYATRLGKGELEVGCLVTYGPAEDPVTGETLDRSPQLVVWIDGSISYAHMGSGRKFLMGRRKDDEPRRGGHGVRRACRRGDSSRKHGAGHEQSSRQFQFVRQNVFSLFRARNRHGIGPGRQHVVARG